MRPKIVPPFTYKIPVTDVARQKLLAERKKHRLRTVEIREAWRVQWLDQDNKISRLKVAVKQAKRDDFIQGCAAAMLILFAAWVLGYGA